MATYSQVERNGLFELSDEARQELASSAYYNEDLKSLTRYRFDKVSARARLKQSVSRLVSILFPELEHLHLLVFQRNEC